MATLIYSPRVTVRIFSTKLGKVVDISDDISSGSVDLILGPGVSTVDLNVLNSSRKYDGVFAPMDRFVLYMRRLKPMLVMSGYLDDVPLFNAIPASVTLRGSSTLKALQNFYWDPGTQAAVTLFERRRGEAPTTNDGGLALRTIDLLTEVAGWDRGKVHIGAVPRDWFDRLSPLAQRLADDAEAQQMALEVGSGAYIGGESPAIGTSTTVDGIGPGTGALPENHGKISHFGGPGGGAYGNMALTGESGVNPADDWYCAMRWPYVTETGDPVPGANVGAAKAWWSQRKIMVVAPRSNKAVVLRPADWGPNINTRRAIDVSPAALKALGLSTDDYVEISFAEDRAPLGPVHRTVTSGVTGTSGSSPSGLPNAITGGWGSHGDERNMRTITVKGCTFTVHYLAAEKFRGFITDLVEKLGYQPKVIYGYNDRKIAGSTSWSNHAWGAAIDVDASSNPYVASGTAAYTLPKPPEIVTIARKWGLGWGGEWKNSKDYMHFEVLGAPSSGTYSAGPQIGPVAPPHWTTPVAKPYTVSARFGDGGTLWAKGHSGTDFACPEGTPIRPVGPGTVYAKGTGDPSYGNWVAVDHGEKVYTFYAHMMSPSPFSVGEAVGSTSDVLGYVGSTGNATGSHVHVELRLDANTYDAAVSSGGIEKYILGNSEPPRGVDGSTAADSGVDEDGSGGGAFDLSDIGGGLLNVYLWMQTASTQAGLLLSGYRALMNDEPILNTVSEYMGAGFRDYSAAPNGDFIAWFPDHFGHYGTAGKMVITPLEIDGVSSPPSIRWSDSNLKTHQFVTGTPLGAAEGSYEQLVQMLGTAGIASVEFPEILSTLLNVTNEEALALSKTMLERFGARPTTRPIRQISGPRQEFYFACMEFMKNWSAQFRSSINVKFMPEIYPGMLACFPVYGIQGYVQSVTHSFDYSDGGGFHTTIAAAPWSTLGDQPDAPGLPKGAPL